MDGYTIMPHEFLYLLCCASDRLHQINKNHKADLLSQKHKIFQWEIYNPQQSDNHISHIHLLSKTAFKNLAPHHLVNEGLYKMTAENGYRYVGGEFKPGKEVGTNYSKLYQKHVDRSLKEKRPSDDPIGASEIDQYLASHYDKSKQSAKKLKEMVRSQSYV